MHKACFYDYLFIVFIYNTETVFFICLIYTTYLLLVI